MNSARPKTWRCPDNFHPDSDGIWEIEQLKKLAQSILDKAPDILVCLKLEDPTCIHFRLSREGKKIGEAYVNRKAVGSEEPMYSVFYEDEELNESSIELCTSKLVESNYFSGV